MALIINILRCLENLSNIDSIGWFKFSCEVMNSLGSLIPRDETAYSKYVFNVSAISMSNNFTAFNQSYAIPLMLHKETIY